MMEESEIKEHWIVVLGSVFKSVDWKKMRGRQRRTDVFEHRLTYAVHQRDVGTMLQKLLNGLSLQAPPLPLERIVRLQQEDELSMNYLRKYTKVITLHAAQYAGDL
ncbi:MAG: hypothetical protein KGI50_07045 [Patescibacteria group bacterium]|nr:hypothetical protein [Patescibacteria group bacterium]MDE2439242.1 hypothetical protein [Patescibacteria group bacterium]